MTEVTLKVMPRPESERTLLLHGLDDVTASKAMTSALGSPFDVSGAAHLPNSAFRGAAGALAGLASPGQAVTLLRLEGIAASAAHRATSLGKLVAPFGAADLLEDAASTAVWNSIRDVLPFAAGSPLGAWPVWRIVCPPASGGALGQALARESGGDVIYDWGGGLIWATLPPKPDAHALFVRQRVEAAGGHATLIRASEQIRRDVDVFHPQGAGLGALGERVRHSFDPKKILNRGRMARGTAMKTEFSLAQLADPDIAEADKILRACALRLLHRDLSDLCAARRRTRQPPRPHLFDQGDAGKRPAADGRKWSSISTPSLLPCLR